jgi:hypothetical protein
MYESKIRLLAYDCSKDGNDFLDYLHMIIVKAIMTFNHFTVWYDDIYKGVSKSFRTESIMK